MKLTNFHSAIIDPQKLRDYCLNPEHPRGKHKARVFATKLGIHQADWAKLTQIILNGLEGGICRKDKFDQYGQRYFVDMEVEHLGYYAHIRTTWIILTGEELPRLTSCYVKQ